MHIAPAAKKRLVDLIKERDIPLAPLALKIGVSQSTLWNFIYGETKNFSKIHRLATELKISLDWILNGDVPVDTATKRLVGRVSEPSSQPFAYPSNIMDSAEKKAIHDITLVVTAIARDYPKLKAEIMAAIFLALWAGVKNGTFPMASARNKSVSKAMEGEARRLVAYELSKTGQSRL